MFKRETLAQAYSGTWYRSQGSTIVSRGRDDETDLIGKPDIRWTANLVRLLAVWGVSKKKYHSIDWFSARMRMCCTRKGGRSRTRYSRDYGEEVIFKTQDFLDLYTTNTNVMENSIEEGLKRELATTRETWGIGSYRELTGSDSTSHHPCQVVRSGVDGLGDEVLIGDSWPLTCLFLDLGGILR